MRYIRALRYFAVRLRGPLPEPPAISLGIDVPCVVEFWPKVEASIEEHGEVATAHALVDARGFEMLGHVETLTRKKAGELEGVFEIAGPNDIGMYPGHLLVQAIIQFHPMAETGGIEL